MVVEIGYFADNSKNIHFWDPLTADGSTPAIKIAGINFTFCDKITGANITVVHQGSFDDIDWFDLESHSHAGSGVDRHTYSNTPVLYIRSTVSGIGGGESYTGAVMSD